LGVQTQTNVPVAHIGDVQPRGSAFVPVDSWIYPAVWRLYSLGYVDTAFLGLRPWTRASVANMLAETEDKLNDAPQDEEAREIYRGVRAEIAGEFADIDAKQPGTVALESVYTRLMGIGGTPLRDSFHLGNTIVNDYGRPYQKGFNALAGFSASAARGPFSLYFRGEYQHAPSAAAYSTALGTTLSNIDLNPFGNAIVPYTGNEATIPQGPIGAANPFRVVEANLAASLAGHSISFGKSDAWLGSAQGGSMAWSNNAENIYNFRIDRVEPLYIPGLSRVTGPFRYDFLVGSLKGHTYPNDPWIHAEKISFKPTRNVEIGFERTVIWGGKGHVPITLHTFLKSFFSLQNVTAAEKNSRGDPGARFGAFDFSWRVPFVRKYLTVYIDSESHDDVSPPSAPRRASIRPGFYLSQFPKFSKLDFRAEAASTDPDTTRSNGGQFNYYEFIQRQGYTNKGYIMGDWIGRESKGGQAWITYHLSGNEWVQLSYRNAKAEKDFIPGGTTQNLVSVTAVKRIHKDLEVNAWVQYERWNAPIYKSGAQSDTATTAQITWYPHKERIY
jgi:hypothetical protein